MGGGVAVSGDGRARPTLGFTEKVALSLHPDLLAFVKEQADANYQTQQGYIRSLIAAEMRRVNP